MKCCLMVVATACNEWHSRRCSEAPMLEKEVPCPRACPGSVYYAKGLVSGLILASPMKPTLLLACGCCGPATDGPGMLSSSSIPVVASPLGSKRRCAMSHAHRQVTLPAQQRKGPNAYLAFPTLSASATVDDGGFSPKVPKVPKAIDGPPPLASMMLACKAAHSNSCVTLAHERPRCYGSFTAALCCSQPRSSTVEQ
eukprot:scaffold106_cov380-Prasinococcus_capsulatus_cf.AAC.6